MFIANLTYIKPLTEVDRYLADHVAFLDRYYATGRFLCSGRKVPRVGGIILIRADDQETVEKILAEDPFRIHEIASYEIIAFTPTKTAPGLTDLLD